MDIVLRQVTGNRNLIKIGVSSIGIVELDHKLRADKIPPARFKTFDIRPKDAVELPHIIDMLPASVRESWQREQVALESIQHLVDERVSRTEGKELSMGAVMRHRPAWRSKRGT